MQYNHSILGGTFDHFHIGHQKLIDAAFAKSEKVTIGISQTNLYQQKFLAATIEDYATREQAVTDYLKEKNFFSQATIIPITDIYGTTLTDQTIEAIFVTEENLPNVARINAKRTEKDFPLLATEVAPMVKDSTGGIISSERIRKGEIDRKGFVYQSVFTDKTLLMPEEIRSELHQPIDTLISDIGELKTLLMASVMLISVGDIITASLQEQDLLPAVAVIDFRTRREDIVRPKAIAHSLTAYNKHGTINKDAVIMLQKAIYLALKSAKEQTVVISGEEDLLALPAILIAPLESVVVYGQHDQGIVVNRVTEALKEKVVKLVKKFH